VDTDVSEQWKQWMLEEHIQKVMDSGKFYSYKFCRLIDTDEDGVTFATQYFSHSIVAFNEYLEQYAPALKKEAIEKFGDKFIAFRTVLEIIKEQ